MKILHTIVVRRALLVVVLWYGVFLSISAQIQRYETEVFSAYQLQSNIQYGQADTTSLLLDVYSPQGDTLVSRPLVIFIHGGGFKNGDKVGKFGTLVCGGLAKRGFVVSSINYRLGVSTNTDSAYTQAVYKAVQDGKTAVRFFRRYAGKYGIDTSQVFVMGSSAGAMTALGMGYWDQDEVPASINTSRLGTLEGSSGNIGYSSKIQGVVSCWGAITDTKWIERGDVPVYCVHGTRDTLVPSDSSFSFHHINVFKYGSQIIYDRAKSIGVETGIRLFQNTGHTLDNDPAKQDSALVDISKWLYSILPSKDNHKNKGESLLPTEPLYYQNNLDPIDSRPK